ncbi:RNA-binding motif protein 25 isoform X2 [Cornus florida]|uniref:RNA-binding motif protein 25 isoform X2 n=1 Tax=Cornus florida TaxID=4283 RepID=UPI0028965D03|nr:RNA-binding motif protein 25 isoform X2 [Cornus florida]XP_059656055.1 RNA-binding motif protein 25 isoform X2 [Cornus florida]
MYMYLVLRNSVVLFAACKLALIVLHRFLPIYAGIPRYPSPYTTMIRSPFPPRPPGAIGMLPILSRPPVPGIRPPIIPPVVRPSVAPSVTPAEKPQTTVYVGKIASTVENDFMLSLLQLCGPVKNWKRAQDPTNGTPKGFGFCEFDSAEGVLRALRLLSKLNVDGLELVLNVNQATREFLESYVEKKKENSKKLKTETEGTDKEEENAPGVEKTESPKPSVEDTEKDDNDLRNKETHDVANFGMVTDEDREADREAFEKLTGMLQERLKTRPLPPPPSQTSVDGSGNSNSEQPAKSKDGDSDVDIVKNDAAEDKNDNEMTSERRSTGDHDRPETSSPDRSRRHDRRSRDKERDLKREKERELERYEREREQERATRERQRELKIREDEHRYNVLVKDWESREREKERKRKQEKDREKEREYKRRRDITDQEPESDDEDTKRRKHKSYSSDERRRRLREKEEDLVDRLKEEEEIAEAKRRADEEQKQHRQQEQDALKLSSVHVTNGSDEIMPDGTDVGSKDKAVERTSDGDCGHDDHIGDAVLQNGTSDESIMESISSDTRQSSNAPARKLGFGLVGSGKRTAVPSVFHEEEDEDAQKEKKMRPLVPIDYSTEELQVGQPTVSGEPASNLVAAAEFAKRISNVTPKEERPDMEKERSRRSHDRSGQRDRDRNEESNRTRNETRKVTLDRERDREHGLDRAKTPDNQKLLDAKQLIDMIPKTKEELFSYKINWAIYDENDLHKRMKPWISKKITEFLGEEEKTLVDYILSSTAEHVKASDMLERLQIILDDEAEMFVLKMWRMLIFEIKKIETGLALRSNT